MPENFIEDPSAVAGTPVAQEVNPAQPPETEANTASTNEVAPGDTAEANAGDLAVPQTMVEGQDHPVDGSDAETAQAPDESTSESTEATNDTSDNADRPKPDESSPSEDGRWDEKKASTLAGVITDAHKTDDSQKVFGKDGSIFDYNVQSRDRAIKNLDDEVRMKTNREREDVEIEQSWVDSQKEGGKEASTYSQAQLEDAKARLEDATVVAKDNAEAKIEEKHEEVNKSVDYLTSGYEELYDLNPDFFANMSTKEFMDIGRQLVHIEEGLGTNKQFDVELGNLESYFTKFLEQGEAPDDYYVNELRRKINSSLMGESSEDAADAQRALRVELDAITDAWFDRTPRQNVQSYIDLAQEYKARLATKKDELTKKKEEFIAQYKPKEDAAPDATEEHSETA